MQVALVGAVHQPKISMRLQVVAVALSLAVAVIAAALTKSKLKDSSIAVLIRCVMALRVHGYVATGRIRPVQVGFLPRWFSDPCVEPAPL
jgi:hypothetical protein